MLDGDDSDPELMVALGGPAALALIERGVPDGQRYWLRVWAARGLFWAWADHALPDLLDAADDEQWRVREWVAKIAGRHGLAQALPAVRQLGDDPVERVRLAARRTVARLESTP